MRSEQAQNDFVSNPYSCKKKISALSEARRNLTNSMSIFNRPSMTYTQGLIVSFSSTGDRRSKNFMNSISCGTLDMSVIFTILSFSNVHCVRLSSNSHMSKSGASTATKAFEDPYFSNEKI